MSPENPFKYYKTSPEIIKLAVMYYIYSDRDLNARPVFSANPFNAALKKLSKKGIDSLEFLRVSPMRLLSANKDFDFSKMENYFQYKEGGVDIVNAYIFFNQSL